MRVIPFRLNPPQEKFYAAVKEQAAEGHPVRVLILKARQLGFSTLAGGLIFQRTATRENTQSLIVAHKEDSTANLFEMYRLFYEELPREIRPMKRASNARELLFENPTRNPAEKAREPGLRSRIRCATAGGNGVGRSFTVQNVHLSEFAFWPGNKRSTLAGIMQAVPDLPGTMVIIETTPNGYDEFKLLWDTSVEKWNRGERDGWMPLFFAWHEMPEYRRPVPEGFRRTEEEEELAAAYGLDDEQLVWRRWCIDTNCGGSLDLFHQEYPASPAEAFVASGSCIFDTAALTLAYERARKLERRVGRFVYDYDGLHITNIRWTDAADGEVAMLSEPREGRPYVIGGDTAGEGSDWFAGQVLDNVTGEQVCVLHKLSGEGEYVRQMYCLGKFYNNALLAIESNFSTFANSELERLGYENLYVREVPDTFTGAVRKSFGFRTDTITRPLAISGLVETAAQHIELFRDYETIGEMLTFVRDERGRAAAQEGSHDDLVMSLAIAYRVRPQQSMRDEHGESPQDKRTVWTKDMWEDYNHASPDARKRLLEKWGRPGR